jgi:hypothetical protein
MEHKNIKYYVAGAGYYMNGQGEYLHHKILPPKNGFQVDHINGDKLDNRPENLRYVSPKQNVWNQKLYSNTGVKYVHVDKNANLSKRFKVQLAVDGTNYHFGRYSSLGEAAYIADQIAMQTRGKYARLNYEWY